MVNELYELPLGWQEDLERLRREQVPQYNQRIQPEIHSPGLPYWPIPELGGTNKEDHVPEISDIVIDMNNI